MTVNPSTRENRVPMTHTEQIDAALTWQKSSRSGQAGNCVEVVVLEAGK